MKKYKGVILLLLLTLLLSACNTTPAPTPEPVLKKAVVGIPQDFDSLDPHLSAATGTQEVMFNIFTGLISITPDGEIVMDLAESITPSEDLLSYTVVLKENVKFHNGETLSSADVVYTFDRLNGKTEDQKEPLTSNFAVIESIEAPDAQTVVFHLANVDVSFLSKLMIAIIPEDSGSSQAQTPVGAGPFKYTGYTPGVGITMERNEDYYGTLPQLDQVEFKIYTDANTGFLALQTGEVDIMNITLDQTKSIDTTKVSILTTPQNMVQLMTLNLEFPAFAKKEVRQALNYAINKDEIIAMLAPGSPRLDTNFSPIMGYFYNTETENHYAYNPEKAKQLLADAGESDLTFSIKVPVEYQFHMDTALLMQSHLQEIGVTMNIVPIEWNTWLSEVYGSALYEASIVGLTGKLDPDAVLGRFESTFRRNFYKYNNPEYDAIIKEARQTGDMDARRELYNQAQQILTDDAVAVFIMDPTLYRAVNNRLSGLLTYPIGFIDMKTVTVK